MAGRNFDPTQRRKELAQRTFLTERYRARAPHIAEMRSRQFGRTPVHDTIDRVREARPNYPVREVWFGDPSKFEGLDAYEGFHRFMRRWINFHNSRDYSYYMIRGCPEFMEQIRVGSTRFDAGYIPVPNHVRVYVTSGVAGALRIVSPAILLPPEGDRRDNVIVPKWTYLSHSAEAAFALADVKSCELHRDGQVNLHHMADLIDENTRAVILATVGNPLAIAISHENFESMIHLVRKKMEEYDHPIIVVADVIYEHFRRPCNGKRLDSVQKILSMEADVPLIETSSFSKMMAMAGQRVGYAKLLWDPKSTFRDHREDVVTALEAVYGTTLCPVPSLVQKSLAKLYAYINARRPVEEELAPVAAVLTALKQLTEMKGEGDTHTMMPDEVPAEIVKKLGLDPEVWFTTSAVAKRTRKLAKVELAKYDIDMDTNRVIDMGGRMAKAGLIEKRSVTVDRSRMIEIVISSVLKHGRIEHKVLAGLQKGLEKIGVEMDKEQQKVVVNEIVAELSGTSLERLEKGAQEYAELKGEFGIEERSDGKKVTLEFYKLKDHIDIPDVEIKDGQLCLYTISEYSEWVRISNMLGLATEDQRYSEFKEQRRKEIFERVDHFVSRVEEMRQDGLPVYLHESYYDGEGNLVPERINSFYVLIGFDSLRGNKCQADDVAAVCIANGLEILGTTPGELFLPADARGEDDSYLRIVALDPKYKMEQVLDIIEDVALILSSPHGSGKPLRQLKLPMS